MNALGIVLVIVGWISARLTVAHWLLRRAYGVDLRTMGVALALNRYGLMFKTGVYWCNPLIDLPRRMVGVVRGHMIVQWTMTVGTALIAVSSWVYEWGRDSTAILGSLAMIEAIWLFANLFTPAGSYRADLKVWESSPSETVVSLAVSVLEREAKTIRPKNWSRDVIDELSIRVEGPGDMVAAYYLFTWANDSGDNRACVEAVERMENSALAGIYPREGNKYGEWAAMVREVLAFSYAGRGDYARSHGLLEGTPEVGAWAMVARAHHDVHEGRLDSARDRLDKVWKLVGETEELREYVVEQNKKILAEWEPPNAQG